MINLAETIGKCMTTETI